MTKRWPYTLPRNDPRHGSAANGWTPNGYSNHDCRCEGCRNAHRLDQEQQRNSRIARTVANGGIAPVPKESHGKPATYGNWRCKCEPCIKAHAKAAADRRKSRAKKHARK